MAFLLNALLLLATDNSFPSSTILATLMIEAQRSSETSVLTKATTGNISEDGILHSHRREKLKSQNFLCIYKFLWRVRKGKS
jgi:hypothetical protein